jgi:Spy/CpxP family protein refolding chaperone
MRNRLMSVVFGFIFIAAAVQFANAQECGCKHKGSGEMHGGMMMEGKGHAGMMHGMGGDDMMAADHPLWKRVMELNLDDKQKEALKALHTKTVKEMIRKKADKTIAHVELQDLLEKDTIDMKAVEAAAKKNESISTDMFMAHIRAHEEVKALLTAEQKKKFKEMMEEAPCGCSMMRGGMMHHEKE